MKKEDSDLQLAFARLSRLNDLIQRRSVAWVAGERCVELVEFEAIGTLLDSVTADFGVLLEHLRPSKVERTLKTGTSDEVRRWLQKSHGYSKDDAEARIHDHVGSADETLDIWDHFPDSVTSYKIIHRNTT